ncbi:MAG: VOC family protein [Cyclobacteriaceae bacterium]|nr:VOC family protein [Cyclobacteriaceae bacterium]
MQMYGLTLIGAATLFFYASAPSSAQESSSQEPLINTKRVAQVAIIVRDIEAASRAWAEVLGVAVPAPIVATNNKSRPTHYQGAPTDAEAKLAFFEMDNLQLELIEPLGGNSTWQNYLDSHGEGIHHIAFWVKGIDGVQKRFELKGMPAEQTGGWDGGGYSYIDATRNLGCVLELLEDFTK